MSRLAKYVLPVGLAAAGVALYKRFADKQLVDEPPLVSSSLPIAGCAFQYGRDAGAFLRRCQERYGDVFTVPIFGRRMTFVLNPHDTPTVLRNTEALSFSPLVFEMTMKVFGAGPRGAQLSVDDRVHDLYRSIKPPYLSPVNHTLQGQLDSVISAATSEQFVEEDLYRLVYRLLFPVTCDTVFGQGTFSAALQRNFESFDERFQLLAAGVPASVLPGCERQRAFIADRLAQPRENASTLHKDRDAMLREHLNGHDTGRHHVALFWAAQANTIPAAFWALAYLLSDATARAAIMQELRTVIASCGAPGPNNQRFVEQGLKQLVLLHSAIEEALRLRTGSMTLRSVVKAFDFAADGGRVYRLRQGDYLCLYPSLAHGDPQIFADPQTFKFDRFYSAGQPTAFFKNGKRIVTPLMLFGGGVSMCPGRYMAMAEIKLLAAMLLLRWEIDALDPVPPPDLRRAGLGVLTPRAQQRVRYRAQPAIA